MSWKYGLTGPIGAGKDTIGRLVAELLAPDVRPVRVAVGDLVIDDLMRALAGPARPGDPPELEDVRGLMSRTALDDLAPDARRVVLQTWGRLRRRTNGLFWSEALEKRLKGEAAEVVYVPDVRMLGEFRVLHALGFTVVELRVPEDVAAARAARRDGRVTSKLSRERDERVTSGAHLLVADITVDNSGNPACAAMAIAAALRARSIDALYEDPPQKVLYVARTDKE
jgi:dephospho-CoA kinase